MVCNPGKSIFNQRSSLSYKVGTQYRLNVKFGDGQNRKSWPIVKLHIFLSVIAKHSNLSLVDKHQTECVCCGHTLILVKPEKLNI